MKKSIQYKASPRFFLYLTSLWLLFLFLFMPHFIELTGTLDTWFLTKGLVMYKDFAIHVFPLGGLILLPLHLLSNWNLTFDPFVGLFVGLASLYLIYLFGRRFLSPPATSVALVFFTLFYWFFATGILYFHEQLIGLLLVAATLLVFDLHKQKRVSANKLFSVGILLSFAELSGQIASLTVATAVLLVIYILWRKRELISKNVIPLAAGLFIPFFPLVLYFLSQNALGDFLYWNTLYYFTYSQSAYSPLSELPIREILSFFIPLILLTGILMLRKKLSFEFLSILVLSISTIPFTVFSIFHFHHFNYALGILAITAGYSYDQLRKNKNGSAITAAVAVFIFLTVSTVLPWYTSRLQAPSLKILNDVHPNDPMYDAILWLKNNTPEDAKLMVFADALFYMRAERLPASRPSKGMPYSWMPFSEVREELKRTPADYWITDQNFSRRLSKDFQVEDMLEFVDSELETCYKRIADFDNWEIWEKVCE